MGEVLASPTTECITNDWPSGETTYCCLYLRSAVKSTLVRNSPTGIPGSTVLPSEEKRIYTAMSRPSAAM